MIIDNRSISILEADMNEISNPVPHKPDHIVAITAIISTTIVLLACIAGCTSGIIALVINTY